MSLKYPVACFRVPISSAFVGGNVSAVTFDVAQGRMIGQLLCAGRPVVDVRVSAQELIRARSYDLPGEREVTSCLHPSLPPPSPSPFPLTPSPPHILTELASTILHNPNHQSMDHEDVLRAFWYV